MRLKNYANRQYKAKDILIFWVARAKLNKQLNKKLDKLLAMMSTTNKEMKAKREIIAKTIETDYQARKAKVKDEKFPKYLYATRLNLDVPTYRNIVTQADTVNPE